MTAGLSVQSHTVFIKQLLPVSTVVANNEMCGTGAMTSLCNRIMYWTVPIHMEQIEGLMQIVQFSKNKTILEFRGKIYIYVYKETANKNQVNNKRSVGSNKILGTILKNELHYACPNVRTPQHNSTTTAGSEV
jgi:hypothetical protein